MSQQTDESNLALGEELQGSPASSRILCWWLQMAESHKLAEVRDRQSESLLDHIVESGWIQGLS